MAFPTLPDSAISRRRFCGVFTEDLEFDELYRHWMKLELLISNFLRNCLGLSSYPSNTRPGIRLSVPLIKVLSLKLQCRRRYGPPNRDCSTTDFHKALFVNNIFGESKDNVLEPQNFYRYPIACQKEQVPHRMRYLALDDKICGITISCDRGSNVSIHTHSIDLRHANGFYERIEAECKSRLIWIYFPLTNDENVSGACVREIATSLNIRDPVIAVRIFFSKILLS
jgi:hypothetical protein